MIKKYIITALTLLFVLVSGICYSCKYAADKEVLLSGVEGGSRKTESDNDNPANKDASVLSGAEVMTDEASGSSQDARQKEMIAVHICGAVKEPGVYELEDGSRLCDLIDLSGGLNEDAAGDYINQAEKLADGKRYYIPTVWELEDLSLPERMEGIKSGDNDSNDKPVNINTADVAELMTLPGIGEAKANSIIEYRNKNGKFKTIEDLMKIPGIKEGLFNRIASNIVAR